ncbi:hypothetical protein L1049_004706 [Liquidambar formosana]|uniref:Pumilio homolog 23 n=1 Tax=Liquidambar formosana TaxID=63359 RepID=A0AAP0X0K9_LIQFO
MLSIGSKGLPLRKPKNCNLVEDSLMGEEDKIYKLGKRKRGMSRKATKERVSFDGDRPSKHVSGRAANETTKPRKSFKHQNTSVPQTSLIRKQVDPETAKYFSEIANIVEGNGVELEERSVICGNALEEARGKELELATDYFISHTLQTLLEGCDVDQLCGFLRSCAKEFPYIAMDRSGSHVAETALKSLVSHLQDQEALSVIEETLTKICQAIVVNPVDVMCNCYGSHVLRSLLCLCKGVPLNSPEFHVAKSSMVLAERLNLRASRLDGNDSPHIELGFPDLLKFLVMEMLKCARKDILTLQVDQYSSLVLQTALKLLVGHDQELLHIILILLGCNEENIVGGDVIKITSVRDIVYLMKETAYSHLMEVILEVAPETLYNELFTKVFRNSLFELSSDHCGNFVVQALVSHARSKSQMELIWEELGSKFKDLLGMGRSGVIASLIAASQRLHTLEHKCCQALAAAVCSANESPRSIVPRILFLESYFCCEDKSNWNWENGVKMHVMGSLILQAVFRNPSEFIQPYINSITSMEAEHILEVAIDARGARVIEAFLSSNISGKHKRKLVMKLRGHFGELSMHASGSFTVEKCFTVSNVSLREVIASELLAVRTEIYKTKQGPHLLRRLDVDGFSTRPDQWRLKQASKQSAYKEFYAAFGSNETKTFKNDSFLADTSNCTSDQKTLKMMRKEIDECLASSSAPSLGPRNATHEVSVTKFSGLKHHPEGSEKFAKLAVDDVLKRKSKKLKKENNIGGNENTAIAGKTTENVVDNQKSSQSFNKIAKKRHRKQKQGPSKPFKKKLKG